MAWDFCRKSKFFSIAVTMRSASSSFMDEDAKTTTLPRTVFTAWAEARGLAQRDMPAVAGGASCAWHQEQGAEDAWIARHGRLADLIVLSATQPEPALAATASAQTTLNTNLTAAKSQIEDTDFAWETARLTKLQIGQQAATAMLAQANAIPNVIMALIE